MIGQIVGEDTSIQGQFVLFPTGECSHDWPPTWSNQIGSRPVYFGNLMKQKQTKPLILELGTIYCKISNSQFPISTEDEKNEGWRFRNLTFEDGNEVSKR